MELENKLQHHVMKIKGYVGIEKATESLEKIIMEAYENSCALSYPRKTGKLWCNRKLEKLRKCSQPRGLKKKVHLTKL